MFEKVLNGSLDLLIVNKENTARYQYLLIVNKEKTSMIWMIAIWCLYCWFWTDVTYSFVISFVISLLFSCVNFVLVVISSVLNLFYTTLFLYLLRTLENQRFTILEGVNWDQWHEMGQSRRVCACCVIWDNLIECSMEGLCWNSLPMG